MVDPFAIFLYTLHNAINRNICLSAFQLPNTCFRAIFLNTWNGSGCGRTKLRIPKLKLQRRRSHRPVLLGPVTPQFSGLSGCFHGGVYGGLEVWKIRVILFIYLCIHLSVCLFVCLSTDLLTWYIRSIYPSIYLSIYQSIYQLTYLPVYLSIHVSIYLSIYLSIYYYLI